MCGACRAAFERRWRTEGADGELAAVVERRAAKEIVVENVAVQSRRLGGASWQVAEAPRELEPELLRAAGGVARREGESGLEVVRSGRVLATRDQAFAQLEARARLARWLCRRGGLGATAGEGDRSVKRDLRGDRVAGLHVT